MDQPPTVGNKGYNAYGPWLRAKFGGKHVYKVIVDAGLSCPNRDGSKGYGGCTYCNAEAFTPSLSRQQPDVRKQVEQGIARARLHYGAEKFIVYFQPNTNTHAPVERLHQLYDEALSVCPEDVVGLSIGTRPDCLDAEKIALLESYTDRLHVDLELGMESIYDKTLEAINRRCTHAQLTTALDALADSPLAVCIHAIFGLPGETREMMLAYTRELNRFPQIQFIKLHHLHVVKGSILSARYWTEPFPLFSMEDYTDFLCEFLPLLRPDIVIQRLFGVADTKLLTAPKWDLPKSAVLAYIDKEIARRGIVQGSALASRAQRPDLKSSAL